MTKAVNLGGHDMVRGPLIEDEVRLKGYIQTAVRSARSALNYHDRPEGWLAGMNCCCFWSACTATSRLVHSFPSAKQTGPSCWIRRNDNVPVPVLYSIYGTCCASLFLSLDTSTNNQLTFIISVPDLDLERYEKFRFQGSKNKDGTAGTRTGGLA